MEPVIVRFTADQDDVVRGSFLATMRSPSSLGIVAIILSFAVCPICGIAGISLLTGELRTSLLTPTALMVLIVLGLLYYLFVGFPKARWKKAQKLGLGGRETVYTFTNERIEIANSEEYSKASWVMYKRCTESKAYYLISSHTNRMLFSYIPKRAFESPTHESAFRAIIEAHLGTIKK